MITNFKGKYEFLSNFYPTEVTVFGYTFKNTEAAFQSQKDPSKAESFVNLEPNQAKALGRKVHLRDDWEVAKYSIMKEAVKAKFLQNRDLRNKLIDTRNEYLIEGNTWNDKIWGAVKKEEGQWVGENYLGKILMQLRLEFISKNASSPFVKTGVGSVKDVKI